MTDQETKGRQSGPEQLSRSRVRWFSVLIVVGVAVWLSVVLAGVVGQEIVGAAWVRVPLFVAVLVLIATCLVLFVRTPIPGDVPRLPEVRGGYGIDGPEQRRVRRALRNGTPLRAGDRERSLAQAHRSLQKAARRAVPVRDRYFLAAVGAYMFATWLLGSPSLTAPTVGSSDLWKLAVIVLVVAAGWLLGRPGAPGRRWRQDRLRRRIEVLENLPVAE